MESDCVRVRRPGSGVLLEPLTFDVDAFFQAIDDADASDFMTKGREQPAMPNEGVLFDGPVQRFWCGD